MVVLLRARATDASDVRPDKTPPWERMCGLCNNFDHVHRPRTASELTTKKGQTTREKYGCVEFCVDACKEFIGEGEEECCDEGRLQNFLTYLNSSLNWPVGSCAPIVGSAEELGTCWI